MVNIRISARDKSLGIYWILMIGLEKMGALKSRGQSVIFPLTIDLVARIGLKQTLCSNLVPPILPASFISLTFGIWSVFCSLSFRLWQPHCANWKKNVTAVSFSFFCLSLSSPLPPASPPSSSPTPLCPSFQLLSD